MGKKVVVAAYTAYFLMNMAAAAFLIDGVTMQYYMHRLFQLPY